LAPNVSDSWNPLSGIVTIPGVTNTPSFQAANKQLDKEVPGLGGIAAVGDFFSRLSEKNTWLRVGEVAVGGILLYVALKAMFPGTVGTATHVAGKAAEAGALA
jgi:hypothetical protein